MAMTAKAAPYKAGFGPFDDREGPHVGVLQNLQLPFPALVGTTGVGHVQEAVQMDAAGDQQRQQRRHGGEQEPLNAQGRGHVPP